MNMKNGNHLVSQALVCLAGFAAAGSLFAASHSLDLRPAAAAANGADSRMAKSVRLEDGVLRLTDLPAGATAIDALAVGDDLSVTLFDDVEVVLSLTEKMATPLGGTAFLATVDGYDGARNAVVLQTADGLQIDVQDYLRKRVNSVFSTADGVTVKEMDGRRPSRHCKTRVETRRSAAAEESEKEDGAATRSRVAAATATTAVSASGGAVVDILVVFDKSAASWVQYNGGQKSFAEIAVQKMNAALANTGLDAKFRFRLVGVEAIEGSGRPDEGDSFEFMLDAIYDKRSWNGYRWGEVQTLRKKVGADVVTVLSDTGSAYGVTGLGFSMCQETVRYAGTQAFNCCAIRAVAADHTMTHEVGHNMGAGHPDTLHPSYDPGPQLYAYSSGYYFRADGETCYTIMGYNDDGYGNDYTTEVPCFSSPDHEYMGVAVGDERHDNTRTLANTYSMAANWMKSVVKDDDGGGSGGGGDDGESDWTAAFKKAQTFSGCLFAAEDGTPVGTVQVKAGAAKTNRKTGASTSALTVTIQPLGEKKVSAKGTLDLSKDSVEFAVSKKDARVVSLQLVTDDVGGVYFVGDFDGRSLEAQVSDGTKKTFALNDGANFVLDVDALCALLGDDTYAEYLPDGLSVEQSGTKWVVEGGAKAGKVVVNKKTGEIDEAKLGANPSGLKLSFKAKAGTFSGSFKAYTNVKGKPKATTVTVTGIVVDGIGYGVATVKKLGSASVTIE